jgi:hypothetical protein
MQFEQQTVPCVAHARLNRMEMTSRDFRLEYFFSAVEKAHTLDVLFFVVA